VKRLFALDLDGTLEDSRSDMVAAARRVRARFGLPPRKDEQLRPFVNAGMDHLYAKCFDDYVTSKPERVHEVQAAYEADYLANVAVETRLYDGVDAALRELRALGTLACVTNKPEHISRKLLDELGIGALFATVIGGDSCERCKPDPMMLRAAVERSGVVLEPGTLAQQVTMIGDTDGDLRMARAFGASSVFCAWGYSEAVEEPADHVARHPQELVRILG
jgi:phosphoglycolate phosphatase